MKNLKYLIITGAAIALIAIIALIVFVVRANPLRELSLDNEPSDAIIYSTNEFGFSVQIPQSWQNYKTSQSERKIGFYLPTDDPNYYNDYYGYREIFAISMTPLNEMDGLLAECSSANPDKSVEKCSPLASNLGENNKYHFSARLSDDYGNDFATKESLEAEQVIKTFSLFNVNGEPTLKTYRSVGPDYSFNYPRDLFKDEYDGASVYVPYDAQKADFADISLYHEFNAQYCAPSGECRPNTIDMKVASVVLEDTIEEIKGSGIKNELVTKTFGNNTAYILSQGAEGEGIHYYFVELNEKASLMISHQYIDENIVTNYKNNSDFIPYAQQKQIVTDIIKSIAK